MSDFAPSFLLPPCPACSTHSTVERPFWKMARHTTRSSGRQTWALVGCAHVAEVSPPGKLHDDPELIALVEDAWSHHAHGLFDEKVAGWSAKARDDFRRNLNGRAPLAPGDAGALEF